MPNFTFGGISVGGQPPEYSLKFEVNSDGYPEMQTVQSTVTDSVDGPYLTVSPDPNYDNENPPYYRTLYSTDFDGTMTCSQMEGFNLVQGGSLADPTKPGIGHFAETNYLYNYTDPGRLEDILVSEWHVAFSVPAAIGLPQNRPITFLGQFNTAVRTDQNHQLGFNVKSLFHKEDDASPENLFFCSKLQGFRLTDIPFTTNHIDVAANHVVLRGPASQTGKFLSIVKNSAEIGRITRYGEFILDGSAAGSGASGETSFFEVRGRVGTGAVASFATAGGTTRLIIDQTEGANGQLRTSGLMTHYGSQFGVGPTDQSGINFIVGGNGIIYTNQTSAGGPAGAVVAKMPVYSSSTFTVVGYIELKALS